MPLFASSRSAAGRLQILHGTTMFQRWFNDRPDKVAIPKINASWPDFDFPPNRYYALDPSWCQRLASDCIHIIQVWKLQTNLKKQKPMLFVLRAPIKMCFSLHMFLLLDSIFLINIFDIDSWPSTADIKNYVQPSISRSKNLMECDNSIFYAHVMKLTGLLALTRSFICVRKVPFIFVLFIN